ncbi:hypothetical protein GT347_08210 [Xylophilus rhododendri]|uniref:Uncharacterized protein n=1 Tax=Xylophilus rhododendri TaxID=2697032 RepID=A0A857J4D7_9BURK|nr:hypothetical protein [Xylophilus rhododendri]QHI97979.1 hypothetical protein GT347_08210 [Xylophilus rhododendri]
MQAGTATWSDIDTRLGRLESRLDAVTEALIHGDGDALLLASSLLRDASAEVSGLLPVPVAAVRAGGPVLQRRLLAAGKRFAACRENLARRSAGVDRAVASLIPSAAGDQATYSKAASRAGAASRFGSRFF